MFVMENPLTHEERIGLRRLLDARRRELHECRGVVQDSLLHGSEIPWPQRPIRRRPERKLPSLHEYEQRYGPIEVT